MLDIGKPEPYTVNKLKGLNFYILDKWWNPGHTEKSVDNNFHFPLGIRNRKQSVTSTNSKRFYREIIESFLYNLPWFHSQ